MAARLIVHGGAGQPCASLAGARRRGLGRAAENGLAILLGGGAALDAVVAAVRELEDDPAFNAGRGSCLNRDGDIEMDASLMDGATLSAGAVGAVRGVRNPILLARAVLSEGRHVLLCGEGAQRFAVACGLPSATREDLLVKTQADRWRDEGGTVGAVALDRAGHLAAATSTGGTHKKHPGRVGDSAVIGAGTYADDALGAASATGDGEAILRVTLAFRAVSELGDGKDPAVVARRALTALKARGRGEGGLIIVDSLGRTAFARSTPSMAVAYAREDGRIVVED